MMTQVPAVLKLLLERLRNEITRLPAVKAFTVLAHSKLLLQLDGALEPAVVRLVHEAHNKREAHQLWM